MKVIAVVKEILWFQLLALHLEALNEHLSTCFIIFLHHFIQRCLWSKGYTFKLFRIICCEILNFLTIINIFYRILLDVFKLNYCILNFLERFQSHLFLLIFVIVMMIFFYYLTILIVFFAVIQPTAICTRLFAHCNRLLWNSEVNKIFGKIH